MNKKDFELHFENYGNPMLEYWKEYITNFDKFIEGLEVTDKIGEFEINLVSDLWNEAICHIDRCNDIQREHGLNDEWQKEKVIADYKLDMVYEAITLLGINWKVSF